MKIIAEINIKVKKGFIPAMTLELYKRDCEIQRMTLKDTGEEFDGYSIEVVYSDISKFRLLEHHLSQFSDKYQLLDIRNVLDETIKNGLLVTGSRLTIDNERDYEMNVLGASAMMLDNIERSDDPELHSSLSKNIAMISCIKSSLDKGNVRKYENFVEAERDALVAHRFQGCNAFPFILRYEVNEDIIRSINAIGDTFAAIRIVHTDEYEELSIFGNIQSHIKLPVLFSEYDEMPAYLLAAILKLAAKHGMSLPDCTIGFIGLGISSMRLTRILTKTRGMHILGYDHDEKLMLGFEQCGGLATIAANVFSNADLVIIAKDHFEEPDLFKMRPGLVLMTLGNNQGSGALFSGRSFREHVAISNVDLSIIFPPLIGAMTSGKLAQIDDVFIRQLAEKISGFNTETGLFPGVFSGIHRELSSLFE